MMLKVLLASSVFWAAAVYALREVERRKWDGLPSFLMTNLVLLFVPKHAWKVLPFTRHLVLWSAYRTNLCVLFDTEVWTIAFCLLYLTGYLLIVGWV